MKTHHPLFWFVTSMLLAPCAHSCGKKSLSEETSSIQKVWQGVAIDQYNVPAAKQSNRALKSFGQSQEQHGDPVTFFSKEPGTHFIQGKISSFGGGTDSGVSKYEVAALTGERLRQVDVNSDYFLAMRFNYGSKPVEGREFFKNRRFLIVNPKTFQAVVARAIDWGPNPRTHRIADASPSVLQKLKLKTDDPVWISFAENSANVGPIGQLVQSNDSPKRLNFPQPILTGGLGNGGI